MAFREMREVSEYADAHGGANSIRIGLAAGIWADDRSVKFANEWLRHIEAVEAAEAQRAALDASVRSAEASKDSARWTMIAAIIAAVSTLLSLAQALLPLFKHESITPPPQIAVPAKAQLPRAAPK